MKRFDIILNGVSRLLGVLRADFSVPVSSDNDIRCQRERRYNGERRRKQQSVYLPGTDGVERRCSHGRRTGDPCSPVSFIGVFLR